MMGRISAWLGTRLPIASIRDFMRAQAGKPLPKHVSWWHTFGSLALFLLVNQIVTGILLMVYYRPTTDHAFESVKFISAKVAFGWLIRGLHSWGSTLMVIVLLLHIARTFFMGAFKKPREMTWIGGAAIFGIVLTFSFTGYLLPWNQLSYWATTVGTEVAGAIPLLGIPLKRFLLGGDAVSQETLLRFYVVHVIILPWIVVAMVVAHITLVRLQSLATLEPVGHEKPPGPGSRPFFPNHVLREGIVWAVFIAMMVTIVFLYPPELGEQADPLNTPAHIKPEWYFLPTYQMLKYFPALVGIFVAFLPPVLFLLWPFLDRTRARRPRKRPVSVAFGIAAIALMLIMGILGYVSDREFNILGTRYRFDGRGIPSRVESPSPEHGK